MTDDSQNIVEIGCLLSVQAEDDRILGEVPDPSVDLPRIEGFVGSVHLADGRVRGGNGFGSRRAAPQ